MLRTPAPLIGALDCTMSITAVLQDGLKKTGAFTVRVMPSEELDAWHMAPALQPAGPMARPGVVPAGSPGGGLHGRRAPAGIVGAGSFLATLAYAVAAALVGRSELIAWRTLWVALVDMRAPTADDSYPNKAKAQRVCGPIVEVDLNGKPVAR